MTDRQQRVIAIATSAGGLSALRVVLAGLPAAFPASVLIVQHRSAGPDFMPGLLAPHSPLPVLAARHGMLAGSGKVLVASPGRHLEMVAGGRVSTAGTGRINFCCPSADVLFASLARHAGPRVIACVLTGRGNDGAAGVKAVRAAGGFVIAQSPRSAQFPDMPQAAIETQKVDLVLPLEQIAFALARLVLPEEQAA